MDEKVTVKPNEWIITEGNTPGYYIYELISGRVGIYHKGTKVNQIEVAEGQESVFLGIIAAIRDDRFRAASVKTETEIKAIMHSVDHISGILKHDIPLEVRSDVRTMIDAITVKNEIDVMNNRLASMPNVSLEIPDGMEDQAKRIVEEVSKLYNDLV